VLENKKLDLEDLSHLLISQEGNVGGMTCCIPKKYKNIEEFQ